VKFLLDTHLLAWAMIDSPRLSPRARAIIIEPANTLYFSVVSLWELAIKGRVEQVGISAVELRSALLAAGYVELQITAAHVLGVSNLPPIHRDPFDRLLVATTASYLGDITLLTHDATVAQYSSAIVHV
jgi:PIN domain nuclease of toxin-antitoxin system